MKTYLLAAALSVSCAPGPTLGQTEEGVSVWHYTEGCAYPNDSCQLDLGSSSTQTCVLDGISGDLAGDAYATVANTGGEYYLEVGPYLGVLDAGAVCFGTTTNRTPEYTLAGSGTKIIAPATAGLYCFLTTVNQSDHDGPQAFASGSDQARVEDVGGSWEIWSSQAVPGTHVVIGATCVDLADYGSWFATAGSGELVENLVANTDGTVACGMTGFGGAFTDNSDTDGVQLVYDTSTSEWQQTVWNEKAAWSQCASPRLHLIPR